MYKLYVSFLIIHLYIAIVNKSFQQKYTHERKTLTLIQNPNKMKNNLEKDIESLEKNIKILNQINSKFFNNNSCSDRQFLEHISKRVNTDFDSVKTGFKTSIKRQASLEYTTKKLLTLCVQKIFSGI